MRNIFFILLSATILSACKTKNLETVLWGGAAKQEVKSIHYNGVTVDLVIDKPEGTIMDVLIVYHGTVMYDSLILGAAENTLNAFKEIVQRPNLMLVSVAYPEENLLMGDNIKQAEAALLWVKNQCASAMGIQINKVFLGGHSQGGYLVTRLNTMHQTDGVIANGPGPLNLVYRCGLEESGQIPAGITCNLLSNVYGSTLINPNAYFERSLLNFTQGQLADILLVQGLNDTPIQMYSWPTFKQEMMSKNPQINVDVVEIAGAGHGALFNTNEGKNAITQFISSRE